jgi:hypothetical protein
MSSPHVIVSAVHELGDEKPRQFWQDDQVRDVVEEFDKEVWDEEWHMSTAKFRSTEALEVFKVETPYHSRRNNNVVEIVIEGKGSIQELSVSGLEDIIKEINEKFERDFTLEAYYWYDGVDRPGGL